MSRFVLAVTAFALVALGSVAFTHGVSAHAAFITSNPAPDSVIGEAPAEIRIVWSATVVRSQTSVTVIGPDSSVVIGDATIDDNILTAPLYSVGPGVYTVTWNNVSAEDGHEASGTFQFTVG